MKLKKEEFKSELHYLVSIHIINDLLAQQIIDEKQHQKIKKILLKHYHPPISTLLESNDAR